MNLPLSTAFTLSHRFLVVVFSFSFLSVHILISFLISSVIYWLFRSVLFSFHMFVFLVFFPVRFSQFSHSVVSDSLQPREQQHARSPCPSPTPEVYPNSCPLSGWCHPAISSSVVPFSPCPRSRFTELHGEEKKEGGDRGDQEGKRENQKGREQSSQ